MEPARTDAAQIRRRLLSEAVRQSGDVALAVLDELGGRGSLAATSAPAAPASGGSGVVSLGAQPGLGRVAWRGNTWSSTAPTRPDVSAGDDDQEQGAEGDGEDEQRGGGGEAAVG